MRQAEKIKAEQVSFVSDLKADVGHANAEPQGYEYWYFDALSDDGREALTLTFYDNFVFSPRYNARANRRRIPAVVFSYYRDGKPLYRVACEFSPDALSRNGEPRQLTIGENSFRFDSAPYGKGFLIELRMSCQQNKILEGRLEWLLIETDFAPGETDRASHDTLGWNLVAPRADVTGHLNVTTASGKIIDAIHFRGTGYHDQKSDSRFLPETVGSWQWGRAHFADSTAVFCRYRQLGRPDFFTRFYVVRHGELRQRDASFEELQLTRDIFGLRYPTRLRFASEDNMRLRVKQTQVIDSSLYYLRFLSEMTLTLRDGKPRKTIGISEHLYPKRLTHRWLDWLVDLRIEKNGGRDSD